MGVGKLVAGCILGVIASTSFAQNATPSPQQEQQTPQSPSRSSSQSKSHQSNHHVQVPVNDNSQPEEVTRAEAAIEKKDYAAAESILLKFVDHEIGRASCRERV